MRRKIYVMIAGVLALVACRLIDFDEYDYDKHKRAHIGVHGLEADVHKTRGGLWVEKKFKFGKIPPRKKLEKEKSEYGPSEEDLYP